MSLYLTLLFALMAAFFLFVGVKVVVSGKPLFLPSRLFFAFMLLAVSPQFINALEILAGPHTEIPFLLLLTPFMWVVLLSFFWVQMQGYTAIGISDDSFRNAVHHALNENHIKFEEQISVIKLTELDTRLQVAVQSWVGTGQLKLRKSNTDGLLAKLVSGINGYYLSHKIKANNVTSVFYIVMGLFMLAFAIAFPFILGR